MDFFTLQDKARKQTRFLAVLFVVAVICIVASVNAIAYFAMTSQFSESISLAEWLHQPYWIFITLGMIAVIGVTSLWRSWQLKTTPDAVAKMVNATPVSLSSQQPLEKRLINVVEEMSLAAGVPMPKVFIMQQEQGINAFVAGLDSSNITLVVTKGLLDNLSRQELQGVIAHEYSHVFHGDMKINVRLIGILAGILVLGQLGQLLLRSRSRRFGSNNKNTGAVVAVGIGLFAVGYIGLFFGRLIKAGISRQREFLADASAVQYTRDQNGISGALYKISQLQSGSLLNTGKAEEMSHLCFGQAIKQGFSGLLATHPPLEQRIKAVNPNFYRDYASGKIPASVSTPANDDMSASSAISGFAAAETLTDTAIATTSVMHNIGDLNQAHIASTQSLIASIPQNLITSAKGELNPASSQELILALLIANQDNHQLSHNIHSKIDEIPQQHRLPIKQMLKQLAHTNFKQQHVLLEMSLARIEQQSAADNRALVMQLSRLIGKDHQPGLTEFMIYASTAKRALEKTKKHQPISRFNKIAEDIDQFLLLLYGQSNLDKQSKSDMLNRHRKLFGIQQGTLQPVTYTAHNLGRSLNRISQLHPLLKKDFISVCVEIVESDGVVNQQEYELLRLLGEYLECPFPISIE